MTKSDFTLLLGKLVKGSMFMMSSSDSLSLSSDIREVTPAKQEQVLSVADSRQIMMSLEPSVIVVKTVIFFHQDRMGVANVMSHNDNSQNQELHYNSVLTYLNLM
jgi:hypothetical protein